MSPKSSVSCQRSLWDYNTLSGNSPLLRFSGKSFQELQRKNNANEGSFSLTDVEEKSKVVEVISANSTIYESDCSSSTNASDGALSSGRKEILMSRLLRADTSINKTKCDKHHEDSRPGSKGMKQVIGPVWPHYLSSSPWILRVVKKRNQENFDQNHFSKNISPDTKLCHNRLTDLEGKFNRLLTYFNGLPKKSCESANKFSEFNILNQMPDYNENYINEANGNLGKISERLFQRNETFRNPSDIEFADYPLKCQNFQNLVLQNEVPGSNEMFAQKDCFPETSPIIHVLRMLSVLEDQLGSLGPKVLDLLAKAIILGKKDTNEAMALLQEPDVCIFFEIMKEKIRGQLFAGIVKEYLVKTSRCVVHDIELMLASTHLTNRSQNGGVVFLEPKSKQNINSSDNPTNSIRSLHKQIHSQNIIEKFPDINSILKNIVSSAHRGLDALTANKKPEDGPRVKEPSLSLKCLPHSSSSEPIETNHELDANSSSFRFKENMNLISDAQKNVYNKYGKQRSFKNKQRAQYGYNGWYWYPARNNQKMRQKIVKKYLKNDGRDGKSYDSYWSSSYRSRPRYYLDMDYYRSYIY